MIKLRDNGTFPKFDPVTGETLWVDERTEAIVTYALCGFANIGSLGVMLGGLGEDQKSFIGKLLFNCDVTGSIAPKRQSEMANIVLRALVGGIFVSILNACLAGKRPIDDVISFGPFLNVVHRFSLRPTSHQMRGDVECS